MFRYKYVEGEKELLKLSPSVYGWAGDGKTFGLYIEDWDFSYSQGDLIDNPAMVVFSLIFEYYLCETNLRVEGVDVSEAGFYKYEISGQLSQIDDYYNDAYIASITTPGNVQYDVDAKILDYDGANGIIKVVASDASRMIEGDYLKIYGIKASEYLDEDSFKIFGSNESLSEPSISFSLNTRMNLYDCINQICIEHGLILRKKGSKWSIGKIDSKDVLFTFQFPLKSSGRDLINWNFKEIDQLITELNCSYMYSYLEDEYKFLNVYNAKQSPSVTDRQAFMKNLLKSAKELRRTDNKVDLELKTIRDGSIALDAAERYIAWGSQMLVECTIITNIKDHIQVEKGDIVFIFHKLLPTEISANTRFIVIAKDIVPDVTNPHLRFTLLQQPLVYGDADYHYIDTEDDKHIETEDSELLIKE